MLDKHRLQLMMEGYHSSQAERERTGRTEKAPGTTTERDRCYKEENYQNTERSLWKAQSKISTNNVISIEIGALSIR